MRIFFQLITDLFDVLLAPFPRYSPWISLLLLSSLTGGLMVLVFAKVSDQDQMGKTKNLIKAHFLAMQIYNHDIRLILAAQKKVVFYNLQYLRLALVPALVMLLPMLLIVIQLDLRFGHRPFLPGEKITIRMTLKNGDPLQTKLQLPPALSRTLPPLRIPRKHEINWQLTAREKGRFTIQFDHQGNTISQQIEVSDTLAKCYTFTALSSLSAFFLYPGHPHYLEDNMPFQSLTVVYPARGFGLGITFVPAWLLLFFITALLVGIILKKIVHLH